jgi:hypothetical protein
MPSQMSDIKVGDLWGKLWITKVRAKPKEYFCECSCGSCGWLKPKHLARMRSCLACAALGPRGDRDQLGRPRPGKRDAWPELRIEDFATARRPDER